MDSGKRILAALSLVAMGVCVAVAGQAADDTNGQTDQEPRKRGGLTITGRPLSGAYSGRMTGRFSRVAEYQQQPVFLTPQQAEGAEAATAADNQPGVIHAEFEDNPAGGSAIQQVTATAETSPAELAPQGSGSASVSANVSAPKASQVAGPQNPSVTVEWLKQSDVNVGQECKFDLVVRNTGQVMAYGVTVEAHFPRSVRLTKAEPTPAETAEFVRWNFTRLKPGEAQTIAIHMIPSTRGELATQAFVRFTGVAAGVFDVKEPLLDVKVTGPAETLVGEPSSHLIHVTNPGTGIARDVTIEALIPAGLEHPRGEKLLMDIGSLNPGESRKVRLSLVAIDGGTHALTINARGAADLAQQAVANVAVIAPSLRMDVQGPGLRYLGRSASYTVAVTNDGEVGSNNVRAKFKVPEGFDFVRASRGGKFDSVTRTVDWFVGGIDASQTIEMDVQLVATKMGEFSHHAIAISEHGARATGRVDTRVEGSAALELEIADVADPVEIGSKTTYEVRIHNKGSKAAANVGLSCELSAGVQLVGADGPSQHIAENGLVVFKSLPELGPGKTAVFQVNVQGISSGNHRFRARLASDSITEPLIFEELTKFYGE